MSGKIPKPKCTSEQIKVRFYYNRYGGYTTKFCRIWEDEKGERFILYQHNRYYDWQWKFDEKQNLTVIDYPTYCNPV